MTLTPTIIIATRGLLAGQALSVNSTMLGIFSKVNSHPMISYTEQIKATAYASSVSALPDFMRTSRAAISAATARAQNILPNGINGTKIFVSLFNAALSFCTVNSSYFSAIEEFSTKNFTDFGIKSNSFKSIISNNISGLFPKLKTAAEIQPALQALGQDLGNFGTAYNFRDLLSFGPVNLTTSLYNQGLTSRNGINDAIRAEGYDPTNISAIPETILINILSSVTGSDLAHILKLTNVVTLKALNNLADLLNVEFLMRKTTLDALNILPNDPQSIKRLGNSLTNLGTTLDLDVLRNFLSSNEIEDYSYLDKINFPVPTDIATALKTQLGSGNGLYKNPTINDMIGTAGGETHILSFKKIYNTLIFLQNKSYGQDLSVKLAAMVSAISSGNPTTISTAQANLTASITTFNNSVNADSTAKNLVNSANQAVLDSTNQLSTEVNNMKLIGIDITAPQTTNSSIMPLLNFSNNLHTYGQDAGYLGTDKLLTACSNTTNVYGNALSASLLEGKNIARSQYVAKNTSSIADNSATDKKQANVVISELNTEYSDAQLLAKDGSTEALLVEKQIKNQIGTAKRISNGNPLA